MEAKALEIRDEGTFIPALAINMTPGEPYPKDGTFSEDEFKHMVEDHGARHWLLRRCGYACDGRPNVILTRLDGNGRATNDPYAWGGRTWPIAHKYIIEHWSELRDGVVIDVEFILGERPEPKVSERFDTIPP
ncbi:MAG: hypothetical protein IT537_08585 [Hyphomicrobiales bacterium]|nr:hypothetical protein [Hyphomicrobiales bacterium]